MSDAIPPDREVVDLGCQMPEIGWVQRARRVPQIPKLIGAERRRHADEATQDVRGFGAQPIHPTAKAVDTASDRLVEDVLSHNSYGARACGWK